MPKYVVVTGGVVSALGKGITSASIGCLLRSRGLKIAMMKVDPYLNVDPGTMSPYQHGEVFVTDDGAETDLDLGHYERFTDVNTSQSNNFTAGQIYDTILQRERRGDFLGGTVQVIPHVTDEIQRRIKALNARRPDVILVELGGTVGDIESLPFLEAIRQIYLSAGRENCVTVHVTLVPFIKCAGEVKTKPTQQSVARLREIGIQPDMIICRTDRNIPKPALKKIALFCNVDEENVIQAPDADSVYEVPIIFSKQNLDTKIMKRMKLRARRRDLGPWKAMLKDLQYPKKETEIAVVGKYVALRDSYKSIDEALVHGGIANHCRVNTKWVEAEDIEKRSAEKLLASVHGVLVPGGFGMRGTEGKMLAVRHARENGVPYFGICLGMQAAVIEFARNVAGLAGANSSEFDPDTLHPVIDLLPGQDLNNLGGTMRLGLYDCNLAAHTHARKAYKNAAVRERHRHRYEFNNRYKKFFAKHGMLYSGINPQQNLVEIVELKDHPWFVACQFHPEFLSRPGKAHPLFREFVAAAMKHEKGVRDREPEARTKK